MSARRQLTLAVLVCAAAAGLALFASSRIWLVEVTARPAPLSPAITPSSGGSLVPALPALALVALAAAGALVATRGKARTVVAALLTFVGLAIPIAVAGVFGQPGVRLGWAFVASVAGCAAAIIGVLGIRNGESWPAMGSRYERAGAPPSHSQPSSRGGGRRTLDRAQRSAPPAVTPGASGPDSAGPGDTRADNQSRPDESPTDPDGIAGLGLWDAIDRGEDPTRV